MPPAENPEPTPRKGSPVAAAAGRAAKPGLHPRDRHARGYDFPGLLLASPDLRPFVSPNAFGQDSVDFADPEAVKALNRALLRQAYGIQGWDLPIGCLCPPIPGRADYLHHLADLLAANTRGQIPRGPAIRVLDIGMGASAIYPLIGRGEYGWSFVGTEVDPLALASARRILAANAAGAPQIILRRQQDPQAIFQGVVAPEETFDLTLCNPPFYGSLREAQAATKAKWQKLGREGAGRNFGGRGHELWCAGGEVGFLRRMIQESHGLASQVAWFTTLVSSSAHLPAVHRALRQLEAKDIRTLPMAQGQKQSRALAWTFLDPEALQAWARRRWRPAVPEETR